MFCKSAKSPIAGLTGSTYGAVIEVFEPKISGKKLKFMSEKPSVYSAIYGLVKTKLSGRKRTAEGELARVNGYQCTFAPFDLNLSNL